MQQDYVRLNQLKRHPRGVLRSLKVGARTMWAGARGKNLVGMGRALIAPLRIGLRKAGVPVLLNTALTDLYVEDGVVRGVYVRDTTGPEAADPRLIRARRGVILGSGGFEHNEQMRVKYQREPITTEWTVGAVANTGDGIVAAEKLGAALEFMEDAWWGPTVPLVGAPWFALSERNSPGSIIVNMSGKRFMNESMPYVEACHHMYGGEYGQGPGPGENVPAWLVFDQQYRDRFIFAGLAAGPAHPEEVDGVRGHRQGRHRRPSWPRRPACPPRRSLATVERFNGFARSGVDEDFHRGESAYDRYYGDPTNKPNPNLGEIKHGPFYAAKMVPGDLGTKGGIRTDVQRPRAARRRLGDRGPLRGRQRQLAGDGSHLSRARRHHRSGDDVRLPGGLTSPEPLPATSAPEGLTCQSISTSRSVPSWSRSSSPGAAAMSSSTTSAWARAPTRWTRRNCAT